nr:MAG TPA: hypothetical protein [Caudoviricetes sp.]
MPGSIPGVGFIQNTTTFCDPGLLHIVVLWRQFVTIKTVKLSQHGSDNALTTPLIGFIMALYHTII